MIDTLAIARALTDAKLTPEQVNAITDAVRQAADHGDYVTRGRTAGRTRRTRTPTSEVDRWLSDCGRGHRGRRSHRCVTTTRRMTSSGTGLQT